MRYVYVCLINYHKIATLIFCLNGTVIIIHNHLIFFVGGFMLSTKSSLFFYGISMISFITL